MIEMITSVNNFVNGLVWGIPAMALIMGTGVLLSTLCGFPQFTQFGQIMKNTLGKAFEKTEAKHGSVAPFKAMCTALAASIGT
ncbi:MAG: sodium:alanine symporter family protein, partial [Bacteroidaceae bacterium]|nr:sodium:alanine symporter family protein [Bacteroidaceae bacterium]